MNIEKGSIVKIKGESGYYRVSSKRGRKANLASVFGNTIYHKGIESINLIECREEWYDQWSKSETYMSM